MAKFVNKVSKRHCNADSIPYLADNLAEKTGLIH